MKTTLSSAVMSLFTAGSLMLPLSAQAFSENFQSYAGNLGSWTGSGTLIDQGGNIMLSLAPNQLQAFDFSASGSVGTLTMDIFDYGERINTANRGTSRFGFSDSAGTGGNNVFVWSTNRSGAAETNYYTSSGTTKTGSQFTYTNFANRPVTLETTPTSNDGIGRWVTWSFQIESNGVTNITGVGGPMNITAPIASAYTSTATHAWIWGSSHTDLGVLVDNITFTAIPEPSSLALLLGAMTLFLITGRLCRRKN